MDRILALIENKKNQVTRSSKTELLILNLNIKNNYDYHLLAENFRYNNIKTEIFFDNKKIATQFKYAEKKSIDYVLFAGQEEFKKNKYNLKNIKSGDEKSSLNVQEIIKIINDNKMIKVSDK